MQATSQSGTPSGGCFRRGSSPSLQAVQPEAWSAMAGLLGKLLQARIVEALAKELDLKGTLDVLRHGFKFYGKTFRLAYFKPAHGLNPEALAQFERNELTVTRQVAYNPNTTETVDLVFALNGVPVATCELKNPMTGQTLEERGPSVPAGAATRTRRFSSSRSGRWCTLPPTPTKST